MKKLGLFAVTFLGLNMYCIAKDDDSKELHKHLERIEKKIDDLGKKMCKCDPEEMMKKMQPMHEKMKQKHEKMMSGMKGGMKKQEEKKGTEAEEHKKHHPEGAGK